MQRQLLLIILLALSLAAWRGTGRSASYPDGWVGLSRSLEVEGLSVNYPGGWVVVLAILLAPMEQLDIADPTAQKVLDTLLGFMSGEDVPEFDDPNESTIGGNTVVQTHGTDDQISATIYSIELDGAFVIASAGTPAGEFDDWRTTFEAIVGSRSYNSSG